MPRKTTSTTSASLAVRPPADRRAEFGMTLVELVAILGIIGLAVAIALPTLQRSVTQSRAQRQMRSVLSLFDTARSEAMRLRAVTSVQVVGNEVLVVDAASNLIRRYPFSSKFLVGGKPASVPDISDYPVTTTFTYTSDGALQGTQGGAFYFSDTRQNYFRLAATQFTGRPRAEMWTGSNFSPRRRDWLWK